MRLPCGFTFQTARCARHSFAISPRLRARGLLAALHLWRPKGAGNAGRSLRPQPCVRLKETHKHNHHGHTGATRHSPRNGFNGFLRALPGDRACLSPSSPRSVGFPGIWHQRRDARTTRLLRPRMHALVSRARHVHCIPPHVRDDRETPLGWGGMISLYCCFYRTEKRKIFW
jgi:hypothetical protein